MIDFRGHRPEKEHISRSAYQENENKNGHQPSQRMGFTALSDGRIGSVKLESGKTIIGQLSPRCHSASVQNEDFSIVSNFEKQPRLFGCLQLWVFRSDSPIECVPFTRTEFTAARSDRLMKAFRPGNPAPLLSTKRPLITSMSQGVITFRNFF
jgi:hypothetical protein